MPGRYAKFEASSGLITSIDSYAYQVPDASGAAADETEVDGAEGIEAPTSSPDFVGGAELAREDRAGELVAVR